MGVSVAGTGRVSFIKLLYTNYPILAVLQIGLLPYLVLTELSVRCGPIVLPRRGRRLVRGEGDPLL
jgi:hypothetical protein